MMVALPVVVGCAAMAGLVALVVDDEKAVVFVFAFTVLGWTAFGGWLTHRDYIRESGYILEYTADGPVIGIAPTAQPTTVRWLATPMATEVANDGE